MVICYGLVVISHGLMADYDRIPPKKIATNPWVSPSHLAESLSVSPVDVRQTVVRLQPLAKLHRLTIVGGFFPTQFETYARQIGKSSPQVRFKKKKLWNPPT